MTLIELLTCLSIVSILTVSIGGGIGFVTNVRQRLDREANAQQILWILAERLTDELSCVLEEETDREEQIWFLSSEHADWFYLDSRKEQGICLVYAEERNHIEETHALLSADLRKDYVIEFASCVCEDACITITDLSVYEKGTENREEAYPLAVLPELTVRAINLEP